MECCASYIMCAVRRLTFVASLAFVVSLAAQTPPPWSEFFVTVNGLRLHVVESGWLDSNPSKPVLILLHGISRHAHTFDHIAKEFAGRYRVLAVDLRGHGD